MNAKQTVFVALIDPLLESIMDPVEALFILLAQHDEVDLERAYLDKFGTDCGAFTNLLHLQGAINTLASAVDRHRDGY